MKKILMIVQGEGRGHLTQAIALNEIIEKSGNQVVATLLGRSNLRDAPYFFRNKFQSPIICFESPSLVYHPVKKSLSISRTIVRSIIRVPTFFRSIIQIKKVVADYDPDIIINLYDILGGIHQFFSKYVWLSSKPMICIAHQYLFLHKDFIYPKNYSWLDKFLVNLNSRLTLLGVSKILALSFRKLPNDDLHNITVMPPLLRQEVWNQKREDSMNLNYILAYMTLPSLETELINWHTRNPDTEIHCFSDRQQIPEVLTHSRNLFFHKINGDKFLQMMKNSKAVVSTAGFESVCEAMLLNKSILMIPIPNHFEQMCNAVDAEISGAGIIGNSFDLSPLLEYVENHRNNYTEIESWFEKSESVFLSILTDLNLQEKFVSKIIKRYDGLEEGMLPI